MVEQQFWNAVESRARAADGAFVYAVTTTGVYCRPSCPSRRPRRENVEFFPLPAAAERAGYRPCRRCRPEQQQASDPAAERVRHACRLIDEALEDGEGGAPSLQQLAAAVGTSPHQLQRLFKRKIGISPHDFAAARRLARVKERLRQGDGVAGALYGAGYGSSSRLYERSDAQLGMTPATYRKRGQGMAIGFTVTPCALGRVLVAATERGIAAVSLGADDAALEQALREEYAAAAIRRDDAALRPWVDAILAHLAGEMPDLALPLDLQATSFQWRVWRALQQIPYGETASYAEIARRIGKPTAVRAVANACAGNRVALVVPCHRVVRGDGAPGGYRWGVERKARLLAAEKARAKPH
ncbi:MAG TPA: bifunctional DNA-binding transcriptional regulator/O6-methylguanine-DNA methyltransferase Ada [Stellaceae bacterium]|jgi:AraC family transcriptional regulator of adaptative response/methylated-DNA-[protein]-cysteine methyltransferase|nr:bifunctional DNA-binding transcriptional regulator/O6-methylguanine-DNA methyltransferase Ada [Stellaceae bacterium]